MAVRPLIIDCDTGEDDALALLLAAREHLPLRTVVSSFGNASIERTTRNTADVLGYGGMTGVPVLQGSARPLQPHLHQDPDIDAVEFVGENGLCNMVLTRSAQVKILRPRQRFADRLLEVLAAGDPVDYVITGPCTNLARALIHDHAAVQRSVARIFVMGGAVSCPGNTGPTNPKTAAPWAEFNFYCDPYAADVVLSAGIPVYLVSWDTTSRMTISYERFRRLRARDATGEFTIRLMTCFFRSFGLSLGRSFELNDPITVLAAMGEGAYTERRIRVITDGLQFGRTVPDPGGASVLLMDLSAKEREVLLERALGALGIHAPKVLG